MSCVETEAIVYSHAFHGVCVEPDLRRSLALIRRVEQQQQKTINWLRPSDESQLETSIAYEHLAVVLTACLSMVEPDPYVRSCMDFVLPEHCDLLYRYANLLKLDRNIRSQRLVRETVEILPGRPCVAAHRHPFDSVKTSVDFAGAAMRTRLGILLLVAMGRQRMTYTMHAGPTYSGELGRRLYQETAMICEDQLTLYESMLDPGRQLLEGLLLREYLECYLYWSFSIEETNASMRKMWELFLEYEISHLHCVRELLRKRQGEEWVEVVDAAFPEPLRFLPVKEYVRAVLERQITMTGDREVFAEVDELPEGHHFFRYQELVNEPVEEAPSHMVVACMLENDRNGEDYRREEKLHPVAELRNRRRDNVELGRMASSTLPP